MLLRIWSKITVISYDSGLIILSNRMNSATLRGSYTKEVRGYKSMLWIAGMAGAIYIKGIPVTKYKRQVTFFRFPFYTLQFCELSNRFLGNNSSQGCRSVVNSEEEWPSKYSKFFAEVTIPNIMSHQFCFLAWHSRSCWLHVTFATGIVCID